MFQGLVRGEKHFSSTLKMDTWRISVFVIHSQLFCGEFFFTSAFKYGSEFDYFYVENCSNWKYWQEFSQLDHYYLKSWGTAVAFEQDIEPQMLLMCMWGNVSLSNDCKHNLINIIGICIYYCDHNIVKVSFTCPGFICLCFISDVTSVSDSLI